MRYEVVDTSTSGVLEAFEDEEQARAAIVARLAAEAGVDELALYVFDAQGAPYAALVDHELADWAASDEPL